MPVLIRGMSFLCNLFFRYRLTSSLTLDQPRTTRVKVSSYIKIFIDCGSTGFYLSINSCFPGRQLSKLSVFDYLSVNFHSLNSAYHRTHLSWSFDFRYCQRNQLMISEFQIISFWLNHFTSCNFFTSVLADGFSLESEWQQVFASFQDSYQYSSRSQQCWDAPITSSFRLFNEALGAVRRAPFTTITITFMFHIFLISFARSSYMSRLSLFFILLQSPW